MADGPFGSNLKAEHYTNKKEARIIQLSNIAENGWRDENVRYTTFEHAQKNISRSIVDAGNLVIAKMMPAGRAMICPSTEKMYVLSSDAVKLVPIDEINNQFLCYAINSPYFKAQVNGNIQGTTRLRTSISKLRECLLALPPINEQSRIVAKIEELFSTLDQMERNLV
jgi:type I restriction enzyme S subunit